MHRVLALAALLLVAAPLGACTHVVHLRNAKTGETATCGGEMYGPISSEKDEHCLTYFHKQGFDPVD